MTEFIPYWDRKGRKLSDLMKKAWVMKKHNFRQKEISEILGVSYYNVRKTIYNAGKIIKKHPDVIDNTELENIYYTVCEPLAKDYFEKLRQIKAR